MFFLIIEAYVSKLSLLSMVTPSNLNCFTILTETPNVISISLGALILLLVTNMKSVFVQFMSSLLNLQNEYNRVLANFDGG